MQPPHRGRSLGSYELGKTLGTGTFGKVKLATHTPTGELVAIKILEKSKMLSEAELTRVTREINILKQVRHSHVAQLYQIIETPSKICLVMEYLSRGELFDLIVRHKKLREIEAARYFFQLLQAVNHMHSLKVSHRDLKPENLMLDEKHNLKVIDFGLSNLFADDSLLKTACGSPCYAAPEMISGLPYSGTKVDLWSCGVVLYAMTVGKLPFDDANSSELYRKIISGRFILPISLSIDLKDLLSCLLRVDPETRFDVKKCLSSEWLKTYAYQQPERELQLSVHPSVLSRLAEVGMDVEYTRKCLEENKHNQLTTAYFLMLKKMLREGFVPQIVSTRRLSPKLPAKTKTNRATTSTFSRHTALVNALRTEDETVLRPTLSRNQPEPPSRPSRSPAQRVLKPAENKLRQLTPHQPTSRTRSTSQTRTHSQKRSISNGRSDRLTIKRDSRTELLATIGRISNRSGKLALM